VPLVAAAIRHVLLRTGSACASAPARSIRRWSRRWASTCAAALRPVSRGHRAGALAGILAAPLTTVYPGMGEGVSSSPSWWWSSAVIGFSEGAFFGALPGGASETFGKVLLPGISTAIVYAVMARCALAPARPFGQPAEAR